MSTRIDAPTAGGLLLGFVSLSLFISMAFFEEKKKAEISPKPKEPEQKPPVKPAAMATPNNPDKRPEPVAVIHPTFIDEAEEERYWIKDEYLRRDQRKGQALKEPKKEYTGLFGMGRRRTPEEKVRPVKFRKRLWITDILQKDAPMITKEDVADLHYNLAKLMDLRMRWDKLLADEELPEKYQVRARNMLETIQGSIERHLLTIRKCEAAIAAQHTADAAVDTANATAKLKTEQAKASAKKPARTTSTKPRTPRSTTTRKPVAKTSSTPKLKAAQPAKPKL